MFLLLEKEKSYGTDWIHAGISIPNSRVFCETIVNIPLDNFVLFCLHICGVVKHILMNLNMFTNIKL